MKWWVNEWIRQSINLGFNGDFPGEPGLAGYIEAKCDGSGGDNWIYKKW